VPRLTASAEFSVSFSPLQDLPGIITSNGLFFERHHAGRPDIDPAQHKLMIHGLDERPEPTVGRYWPFAPTLWDYINRAMPMAAPHTLSADDVYALTAYILSLNDLVPLISLPIATVCRKSKCAIVTISSGPTRAPTRSQLLA
jgi:hypothetical protein